MFDKSKNSDEIKMLYYLDAATKGMKDLFNATAPSEFRAIIRNTNSPRINNLAERKFLEDCKVLLANTILRLNTTRRLLVLDWRQRRDDYKIDEIEKSESFAKFKNSLFEKNPSLAKEPSDKILTTLCNCIAHGDVLMSFDFTTYKTEIAKFYQAKQTLNVKEEKDLEELEELLRKCCILKFNYTSKYTTDENGNKVKRPQPLKSELTMDYKAFYTLMLDVLADKHINHYPVSYGYIPFIQTVVITDIKTNEQIPIIMDETQIATFKSIFKECSKVTGLPQIDEVAAVYTAIYNILVGNKFTYMKILNIQDAAQMIPKTISDARSSYLEWDSKLTSRHYLNYNQFGYSSTLNNYYSKNPVQAIQCEIRERLRWSYTHTENYAYKEMLISETLTMLQYAEKNDLLTQIADRLTSEESLNNEQSATPSADNQLKTIKHIRNAFVHGYYINDSSKDLKIYDQISKDNKDVEYKFTVNIEQLENIKDCALNVLTEHDMTKATNDVELSK